MVDRVSSEKRSGIMRAVRSKHTGPEMRVRSAAHGLGLRFRLHDAALPGKPDLVFKRRKTVVFVNGCFWHRHADCSKATMPKSNVAFWDAKFAANRLRDARNIAELSRMGWRVVIVWQCEAVTLEKAIQVVARHFSVPKRRLTKALRTRGTR